MSDSETRSNPLAWSAWAIVSLPEQIKPVTPTIMDRPFVGLGTAAMDATSVYRFAEPKQHNSPRPTSKVAADISKAPEQRVDRFEELLKPL